MSVCKFPLSFVDLVQLGKEFFVIRNSFLVLLGKAHDSLLVNDKDRSFGVTFGSQAIIQGANRSMGMKIGQHREVDAPHLLGKGFMRKDRVNADAQNLSVLRLEAFSVRFEVR